jgi:cytochrome c biogenesis protein CcmG, thiol:disulfide interchange protein DsbE
VTAKRLFPTLLASLLGVALLGLLIYGVSHQAPNRTLDQDLADGLQPLPPHASQMLPRLTGSGSASLASYRGHVVVLNFWASWCPPCQSEAPTMERLQRELQRYHATVLGVTDEDITSDSLELVHHDHLTYPNLRDGSGEFVRLYGTDQLPESFLIDPSGRITLIERNAIGKPFIERALRLAESA